MTNTSKTKESAAAAIKRLLYGLLPAKLRFTRIYKAGGWGCPESVSGGGSTLSVTAPIREEMPELLQRLGVKSMLDAPCGDFNWMRELLKDAPADLVYYGADIVEPLIESIKQYETDKVHFVVADIINDELPAAELILCRDCFIHLSNRDIRKTVDNFKKTGASYLLTNSFSEIGHNKDIQTGRWRQINLRLPPFNFPEPIAAMRESGSNGKFIGVWRMDELPV